ncbi:MAG: NAD(P)/FAD-dependent oxidoreductase [Actinobacteria bacterium]|nr:NAD(P)/FAD-dependent oxidoreductase [Actinomycetota bacterium]
MGITAATTGSENRRRAHVALPERVDVAVIGSGLGGLVAAARLAQEGRSVAVFEGHYTAGGCATQFTRGPKRARWAFDVGLHYIGDCAPGGTIPRILDELGVSVDFAELDPHGFDTLVFPDFRFRIPASLDLYRERLVEMFPRERRGIDGYVKLVQAVMNLSRMMEKSEGRRPSAWEMAKVALDGMRVARWQNATIGEVLRYYVTDPKLAAIMLGQSGDYGVPPSRASALLHLGLAGHYFRGAYYPKGGGQVIADRIAARLESLGGTVHLRTPVEKIVVEGGRVTGVRLAAKAGENARTVRANVVISNADLKRTFAELVGPEHLSRDVLAKNERWEMAAALFMTVVGLRGDGRDLGMTSSNIWQFDHYDGDGFYAADRGEGPIGIAGCYVTSASLKDPENALHHAPAGHTGLEIMAIVPHDPKRWGIEDGAASLAWGYKHGSAYLERKAELEENLIARLEAIYPGAKERIVFRESATPMTHRRFTGATDGTGYGLAATPEQFMKKRPGYRGPLPGLYLTGASTRAGHGIVGAMMGGRAAAMRVAKDLGVGVELRDG